jgi:hypothetical protein
MLPQIGSALLQRHTRTAAHAASTPPIPWRLLRDLQHPIVQGVSNVEGSHCIDRHAFGTIQVSTNCSLGSVSSSAAIPRKCNDLIGGRLRNVELCIRGDNEAVGGGQAIRLVGHGGLRCAHCQSIASGRDFDHRAITGVDDVKLASFTNGYALRTEQVDTDRRLRP